MTYPQARSIATTTAVPIKKQMQPTGLVIIRCLVFRHTQIPYPVFVHPCCCFPILHDFITFGEPHFGLPVKYHQISPDHNFINIQCPFPHSSICKRGSSTPRDVPGGRTSSSLRFCSIRCSASRCSRNLADGARAQLVVEEQTPIYFDWWL